MASTKLDNPVWHSLNETHQNYVVNYNGIRFYHPNYCPFGGFTHLNDTLQGIHQYASLADSFFVVGEKPLFTDQQILKKDLICNQMVLEKPINIEPKENIIELITEEQKNDLFHLVTLVQPGYFKKKTSDLGRYFGIYKNNILIAATGERMKMNDFTEVSAVVTHPNHTRKGYAKQLITHTTNQIFNENKTPYLHVTSTNTNAIKLYEKLGFYTRRKISFWQFKQN